MAEKDCSAELVVGAYLTDGTRLYRVVDALEKHVLLEDSGRPDEPVCFWMVEEVLRKLKVVPHRHET